MPNPRHEVFSDLGRLGVTEIQAKLPDGTILVGEEAVGQELDRLYDATHRLDVALDVAAELCGDFELRGMFCQVADMILREQERWDKEIVRLKVTNLHLTTERDRLREELEQHGRTDADGTCGKRTDDTDRDTRDAIGHAGTC